VLVAFLIEMLSRYVDDCVSAAEEVSATSDPVDVLDRDKCLQLLAELRHAKWFQVF